MGDLQSKVTDIANCIATLPEDPKPYEWKVGEWAYHPPTERVFKIYCMGANFLFDRISNQYSMEDCIPVHFIQTAESKIGEGSIVRTPDGWVGSVTHYADSVSKCFVYEHGAERHYGWYSASELTLCPPEGK